MVEEVEDTNEVYINRDWQHSMLEIGQTGGDE